jgi:predicted Zn-dependent protease
MDNDLRRFQYAHALTRSRHEADRKESVIHLEYLINHSHDYVRDALYLLATVRYLMHQYEASRNCAEELCRLDPDNEQVSQYKKSFSFLLSNVLF